MIRFLHIVLLALFLMNGSCFGQSGEKANNKIKGMYVYQFAKNVDWPKEFKSGDFVIGVYGEQSLYDQLASAYSGKLIGSQSIKIKYFDASSEVNNCHILYIASKNSSKTSELAKKLNKNKTLIVANADDGLANGAVISFVVRDAKIAFEVSKKNAEKSDLIIGQTLTKLASNVM